MAISNDIIAPQAGDDCFYCFQPIGSESIYWMGEQIIFLHRDCAVNMMIRLMRDVHEFDCKWKAESNVH